VDKNNRSPQAIGPVGGPGIVEEEAAPAVLRAKPPGITQQGRPGPHGLRSFGAIDFNPCLNPCHNHKYIHFSPVLTDKESGTNFIRKLL
jgi:hypothetical protein